MAIRIIHPKPPAPHVIVDTSDTDQPLLVEPYGEETVRLTFGRTPSPLTGSMVPAMDILVFHDDLQRALDEIDHLRRPDDD